MMQEQPTSSTRGDASVSENLDVPDRKVYGESPDIKFKFPTNEGSMLLAEKHQLMKISEVFQKQFSTGFSDGKEFAEIAITDITFETFNSMLNFIYNDNIDIYEGNFLEILYSAKKYFIFKLIHKAIDFIQGFINQTNLTDYFEVIEKFDLKAVNDKMRDICVENPLIIIKNLNGSESHKRILKIILKSPYLPCSEYALYIAIMQMMTAKYKSDEQLSEKIRQELGNLIYLIRFPAMTANELILCAKPPCPLNEKEIEELLLWRKKNLLTETILYFSTQPRLNLRNLRAVPHLQSQSHTRLNRQNQPLAPQSYLQSESHSKTRSPRSGRSFQLNRFNKSYK